MDKEYSPWYYHNKALRDHPEYLLEGLMDCYREEQSYYQPYCSIEKTQIQNDKQPEPKWTRQQWDYIQQIKAEQIYLRNRLYELLKKVEGNGK